MDAADGLVGKSLAVLFLPEQTAILFEPGVELLDVAGGEFVQRNRAQVRDDVLIDPPFIGHLGVGAKIWLFVGLIPKVQPLGGCHGLPGWLRLRSFLCGNQTFEFFSHSAFVFASTFLVLGSPLSS